MLRVVPLRVVVVLRDRGRVPRVVLRGQLRGGLVVVGGGGGEGVRGGLLDVGGASLGGDGRGGVGDRTLQVLDLIDDFGLGLAGLVQDLVESVVKGLCDGILQFLSPLFGLKINEGFYLNKSKMNNIKNHFNLPYVFTKQKHIWYMHIPYEVARQIIKNRLTKLMCFWLCFW